MAVIAMWQEATATVDRPATPGARYYDDLISEMYDESWYGGLNGDELAYYMAIMNSRTCFELAAGTGRLSVPLLLKGVDLYGIDNSPPMLSQLHDKLKAHRRAADTTRFIHWEALDTPYPCAAASFEVAIVPFASYSLIHSNTSARPEENSILRELNRILTVGGTVVINDYRTGRFDESLLRGGQVFNHDHVHPIHGQILEEQISTFAIESNPLIEKQVIRSRTSRLIRKSDRVVLRTQSDVTPLWDIETFPLLGHDAGFAYVRGDIVDFYTDRTINHVFRKERELG